MILLLSPTGASCCTRSAGAAAALLHAEPAGTLNEFLRARSVALWARSLKAEIGSRGSHAANGSGITTPALSLGSSHAPARSLRTAAAIATGPTVNVGLYYRSGINNTRRTLLSAWR
eukprot:scaffold166772_cov29-Tisochrysis_lutea.AAC.1